MAFKLKIPHTFTIVFAIIIVCAVATWIIPGGEYAREKMMVDGTERSVVDASSFKTVDNVPQTWQVFTAFFKGFTRTSNIIIFILMIGGAFWGPVTWALSRRNDSLQYTPLRVVVRQLRRWLELVLAALGKIAFIGGLLLLLVKAGQGLLALNWEIIRGNFFTLLIWRFPEGEAGELFMGLGGLSSDRKSVV